MAKYILDTEVAKLVGVNAAVIYENLCYWVDKNKANGVNKRDDKYWTYSSVKAFGELFGFMSDKQIRTALDKLEKSGLVVVGTYNNASYDRTKWYSTVALSAICPKGEMELPKKEKGSAQKGEPIPNITTDGNSSLFPSVPDPDQKTLFKDSVFANEDGYKLFLSKFDTDDYSGIDIAFYYHSVNDWAENSDKKRTAKGWLATARTFMRGDKTKNKLQLLKTKQENEQMPVDYLNL